MAKRKRYYLTDKQCANIILAARHHSACPKANKFVKRIDKKFKLKELIKKKNKK